MRTGRIKVISLLLAVLMTFSLLPVSALAEDAGEIPEEPVTETMEELPAEESAEVCEAGEESAAEPEKDEEFAEELSAEEPAESEEPVEELPAEEPAEVETEEATEGEEPIGNEEFIITDGDATESEEEEESPFPGMPEDFELSEAQLAAKANLSTHGVPAEVESMTPGKDFVKNEVIFLTDDAFFAQQVADAYDAEVQFSYGTAVLTLRSATVAEAVTAAADLTNSLPAVEPNYITYIEPDIGGSVVSGPTLFSSAVPVRQNWESLVQALGSGVDPYLKNPSSADYQWMHDTVNTYEAWGVTTGAGVTVALIDSGVNAGHEDLSVEEIDIGCGSGPQGTHGTHVAGIVGAKLGNGKGGAGVAPDAGLISIRVVNSAGGLNNADIIRAIKCVAGFAEEGQEDGPAIARVMNLSLGGMIYSEAQEQAIRDAIAKGVVVVVAMGNNGSNNKMFPAAYDIPGLIAVANVDRSRRKATSSTYGAWCDVAAPGAEIMSTTISGYGKMSGTSMAAPVVAGMCALYLSVYSGASPAEVERAVKAATNPAAAGLGTGIVDAAKLFSGDKTPPVISCADFPSGSRVPFEDNNVSIIAPGAVAQSKGLEDYDNASIILYTTDGTAPAILNGEVKNGEIYTGPIPVGALGTVGKNVKLRAACVTGMGIMSKISAYSLTVDYATPAGIELQVPNRMLSGKTVTLAGTVYPQTANPAVTWEVREVQNCTASVSGSKLTATLVSGADEGSVTLWARYGTCYFKEFMVTVACPNPVAQVELGGTALTLRLFADYGQSKTIEPLFYDAEELLLEGVSCLWTSSNAKVVKVTPTETGAELTAVGKGSATVTCKSNDGSGKSAAVKVTVLRYADSVSVSGQDVIAPGKSASYKAALSPTGKQLSSTAVTWTLGGDTTGITLKGSKVYVSTETAEGQTFTLTATAAGGATCEKTVTVVRRATSVTLLSQGRTPSHGAGNRLNGATVTLFTLNRQEFGTADYDETKLALQAVLGGTTSEAVMWSSSNAKVAAVSGSGLEAEITAVAPGTATVTCKANDGSGKKASFKVKVVTPCSGVSLKNNIGWEGDWGDWRVAKGTSVKNTAVLGDTFGTPTVKGVRWSIITGGRYASVSSSGRLTVKKTTPDTETIVLRATAKDLSGEYCDIEYTVNPKIYGIEMHPMLTVDDVLRALENPDSKVYEKYSVEEVLSWAYFYVSSGKSIHLPVNINGTGYGTEFEVDVLYKYGSSTGNFYVSSSNPNVASAYYNGSGRLVIVAGTQKGAATVTVKAADGSDCTAKLKVIVE